MASPPESERRDAAEAERKEEERKRREEESWEGVGSNQEALRQESRRFLEPEPALDVTTASIHPDEVCAP